MMDRVIRWMAAGAIVGMVIGAADAGVIFSSAREMFFDAGEMYRTMWMCVGMCSGAGATLALLLGIPVEAMAAAASPSGVLRGFRVHIASAFPIALILDYLLWNLTSGPQASRLMARPVTVALAASLAGIACAVIIVRAARASSGGSRRMWSAAFVAIAVAGYVADFTILVRLYPAFHMALSAVSLFAGAGAIALLWRSRSPLWISVACAIIAAGGVTASIFSLKAARSTQNPRFVIARVTPTSSDVLSIARAIAPPPRESLIDEIPLVEDPQLDARASDEISLPGSSVILLTVDAMRRDRVAVEGAVARRPAPAMEAFAEKAIVFERAYTAIPHTSYAVASLLTGKYVAPLFDVPGAPEVQETWPQIMKRFRYETGAFFTKAVFFIDRPRFEPYLRIGYGFNQVKMDYEIPAGDRAKQTVEFLKEQRKAGKPVMSWTHFFEPHEPYDQACTRFGDGDEERYDCEIAVVDEAIAEILAYVDDAYPDAIVIITADHGEEFGDHGGRYHGTTLYEEQIGVPLLVRVPGIEHRRVSQPVSLVDLMGTVLAALDIPVPARVRSRDLGPLMLGHEETTTAFCEVHDEIMAVRDGFKLHWDRREDVASLYDLSNDPSETRSVAAAMPDRVKDLKGRILAWELDHARIELRPVETMGKESGWPEAVQRAMSGDAAAIANLPAVLASKEPVEVKRKAAQLMAAGWMHLSGATLSGLGSDDPEARAWILLARHRAGQVEATSELSIVQPSLEIGADPWRQLILARAGAGDAEAVTDLIGLIANEEAPVEQRLEALDLLNRRPTREALTTLTGLIDNYQLSLKVAEGLAAIGDRSSIPVLITRLKRERFPERRLSVAGALATFRDPRVPEALAGELAREEPATGVLSVLATVTRPSPGGATMAAGAEHARIFVAAPSVERPLPVRLKAVTRVFVLTRAKGDGGSVEILCDGEVAGKVPVHDGEAEGYAELSGCETSADGEKLTLTFRVTPEDRDVVLAAIAAVGD